MENLRLIMYFQVPRLWQNIEDVMGEPNKEYNRPSTAGVHITEHPPGKINPSPVSYDETEHLIEEYLSPRKLVSPLCGIFINNCCVCALP